MKKKIIVGTILALFLTTALECHFWYLNAEAETGHSTWFGQNTPNPSPRHVSGLDGVRVALYNGSGAGPYSVIALKNLFEWMGCSVEPIHGEGIMNGHLENFDVLAWPGGDYVAYWWEVGWGIGEGKSKIQDFVSSGGGYIGICAGAYYACDYMVWYDDANHGPPDYKVEGDERNLDLFPGVAHGTIHEIADPNSDKPYAMTKIRVNHTHAITDSLPDYLQIFYYGGPYLLPYEGADVTVLGRYNVTVTYPPTYPNVTKPPAIVACEYGNGSVFLTGPHPEFEEDSDRDGWPPEPDLSDEGSDWPLFLEAMKWVMHVLDGDLNGDRIVDIFDVVTVSVAFGSTPLDPNWNAAADLNIDDVVDIFDVVTVATNFGKTA